jgi:DNA polymerase-4
MDSFYASVHIRDDPSLEGKPVIIGGSPKGRGVVAAASYEVRKFGVHSAMPAARAVRLCPHAVFIKPDFSRYRAESQEIFEIFRRFTAVIQPVSIDEAYLDVSDHLEPWGSGTAAAKEIKRQVKQERGLTVSVGVGPNRLIAKIASDFDKPDGLTVVKPGRVHAFLDPMSVRSLPGVGPATERRIKRAGIETIGELRAEPLDRLEQLFGRHGSTLYRYARGIDERPVRMRHTRKSLSTERTYAEDLEQLEEMDAEIDRLSEKVAASLQKKELSACTLTVKIRYGDFTTLTRSRTLDGPTNEPAVIAGHARELLRQSEVGKRSVRLLGVGASNLVRGNIAQLELFA